MASPSMAFAWVGKTNKFWSGTSSTASYGEVRLSTGSKPANRVLSLSRLNYRNNGNADDHSNERTAIKSTNGRWVKPVVKATSKDYGYEEDTSRKVDEYLEFLDKRYNRMRGSDVPQPKHSLHLMKWIRAEEHDSMEENPSNSLYALGVAGLASERLLQKQGVHLRLCSIIETTPEPSSVVVEHVSEGTSADGMSLTFNKIFASFTAKFIALHRQWRVRRDWLLRSLSRKTRASAKAALKAFPKTAAELTRTMIKAGGGERNLKVAATFTCAFAIYIAHPLAKSAITARTQV